MAKIPSKQKENEQPSLAVVVSSYDGASDLWEAFFHVFDTFWSDCPFPVYLVTNTLNGPSRNYLQTLQVGPDKHWASNLKTALKNISAEYVLYLQEDYFLDRQVNTSLLLSGLEFLHKHQGACLRLMPSPRPDISLSSSRLIGEISVEAAYRVCLQATIWNKKALQQLLVDGEDGWAMEDKGTQRSRQMEKRFFSYRGGKEDKKQGIPLSYFFIEPVEDCFFTGVNRGYWLAEAVEFLEKQGCTLRPLQRPVCSAQELYEFPEKFLSAPISWRQRAKNMMNKLFSLRGGKEF